VKRVYPPKLQPGDLVRIVAPSRSLTAITHSELEKKNHALAVSRLESLGLRVDEAEHIYESDPFDCPPIESRLHDLHQAFADPEVKGLITVIGGWNGNQILERIDWDLIAGNPKVFCGYSDITVFNAAMLVKSGLVTYSGPHISTFGMRDGIEPTVEGFQKALMQDQPFELIPTQEWSEDPWFLDQDKREFQRNPGYLTLQEGEAQGTIIGGNLCTLSLLQGTEFMPSLEGALLFLEDLRDVREFDRLLHSLLEQPGGESVRGLVIGRFPSASEATPEALAHVVAMKQRLKGLPVIYGADFGHTAPHMTFPIGGEAHLRAVGNDVSLVITEH